MAMDVRQLGRVDYLPTYAAMQDFTAQRIPDGPDALWICEHNPVFTQGLAGKAEHILHNDVAIPVVQTNRGGQVTFHGPGQVVALAKAEGVFKKVPDRDEFGSDINESLIVELYSR